MPIKSPIVLGVAFVCLSAWCAAQAAAKPSAGIASPAPASSSAPAAQSASSEAGYRIAGVVVSKTDGHPLVRALVAVAAVKDRSQPEYGITSDDGRFEFRGVPAGKYSLSGQKRGFIPATYDQHDQYSTAIVTGAGLDTENLVLKLAPDGMLAGKVVDEAGDAVRRATVTLYYNDHQQGVDEIRTYRGAMTDDLGAFEFPSLRPGTYFLSATARPWYAMNPTAGGGSGSNTEEAGTVDPALDVAYPVTYYPDVAEADSALPIPMQGGERVEVDLHLNPVPALRLRFHVAGDGKNGFSSPTLEQAGLDGSTSVELGGLGLVSPGVWEIGGIPAGRYNVRMRGPGAGAEMEGVELTKNGEDVDISTAAATSVVKVSIKVEGEGLPPQLTVGLRAGRRPIALHQVDAKGEAELDDVPAGKYEFVTWSNAKRYSIAQIAAEGAEVSGRTLTLTPGASPSVSLTLWGGNAEIQGIVKKSGKGLGGAMVVLVPKNAEGNRDLFRRDQSDLDGTFALRGVVPGSYTVLAIENGWDLDWSQPQVIAAYLRRGQKIVVGPVTQPLKLAEEIEAQSK